MFKDIIHTFGLEHNCHLLYYPSAYIVYEIKYDNHKQHCKAILFPYE
jgi:hypothetical protein